MNATANYPRNAPVRGASTRLPDDYIQRVMDSVDLVSIIGEHMALKKQGSEYTGCCPFHNEKSASFSVNPVKQVYYCRGCGAKGTAMTFLEEHQGMKWLESLEFIAVRASLPRPSEVRGTTDNAHHGDFRLLVEINERAARLFREELQNSRKAIDYIHHRGITEDMVNAFGIGYAPANRRFLQDRMKDVPTDLLVKAGLIAPSQHDSGHYDLMSDRIIFPIRGLNGQTIAFGGRTLSPDVKPKYLNTPETMLFRKGQELYGWHEANRHIHKAKTVIVGEGYLDTVIPSGYGIHNFVSAMGVAVQPPTLAKMFKSAEHIIYCFDGDAAGTRAAQKALDQSLTLIDERHRCSFVFLPEGMDPAEYVLKFGPEKFNELIASAEPLSKFLIRDVASRHDVSVLEGKARFAIEAMEMINRVESPFLRNLFSASVTEVVGTGIPLPGGAPAGPAATIAAPLALVPAAAVFTAAEAAPPPRTGLFAMRSRMPPPVKPTPPDPKDAASLLTMIVGMLVKDPEAARNFNPNWVNFAPKAKPEEIEAVHAIIEAAKDDSKGLTDSERLVTHFQNTPTGEIISKARDRKTREVENDALEELSKLAHFLIQCRDREMKLASFFKRP